MLGGVLPRVLRETGGAQGVLLRVIFLLIPPRWAPSGALAGAPPVSLSTPGSTPLSTRFPRARLGALIVRKILVSVKFLSAILGPEIAAPIVWAPRTSVFSQENLHIHKIVVLGGRLFWAGGEVPILFLWARGFF